MSEATSIVAAALCGLAAGGIFFGGLWLSTAHLVRAQHRIVLVIGSFLLRSAIAVGLAWLAVRVAGQWGILAYLVSLTAIRFLLIGAARRKRADNA